MIWAEDNHYFGISMQGAYTTAKPYQIDVNRIHGGAGGAHLLYEYQHNHFLMNIGAGFMWQQTGWMVPDAIKMPPQPYVDTQGDRMTLYISCKRWDEMRRGLVDIPILVGGEWGIGYLLGGLKMGIGVVDKSKMKAEVTTVGTYDQYVGPIHDAANHGLYTAQPIEDAYTLPSQLDLRASLEGGVNIAQVITPTEATVKVRLGAFIDYGLFFARVDANTQYIQHEGNQLDLSTYHLLPILTTGTNWLDNLMAGVKVTVLIGAPGGANYCPTCHILDDRWQPIQTKRRCIICEQR